MAEEKVVNKDTEEVNGQSFPIYDTPKKPVVAPRTRFNPSLDSTNENSTTESKPIVPPKRTRTSSQISSIIENLNSNTQKQDLEPNAVKPQLPTVSRKPSNIKPKPVFPKPFDSSSTTPKTPPFPESTSMPAPSTDTTELYDDSGPRYVMAHKPKAEEKALPDEMPDYAEPDTMIIKPASITPSTESTHTDKYKITSKPYDLEDFAAEFPLPQIIRVYSGYYGITEQFSMSEGEELILFFIKSSKIIMASTRSKAETYHLPLNTTLQFSPYLSKSSETTEHATYRYKTIGDLIQREEGLPKVVKVFKSFSGVSEESSVSAGDLIFPKKVSGKKKKTVLKCKNKSGQKLKLALNCVGDFSVDPSDVRMYLLEYIEYINEFPYTAMVFNDDDSGKLSCLRTGTVLILEAPQPLRSYICSTDIFGEKDYPIVELPMIMPIQIQCMERPELNMEPIYNKVQHAYENFKPSMIKKSLYPAQNQSVLKAQQQFYEEVKRDDGSSHLYDLERPEAIYEAIPGENAIYDQAAEKKRLPPSLPPLKPISKGGTNPPVSAVQSPKLPTSPKPVGKQSDPEHTPSKLPPSVPPSPLAKSGTVPPAVPSKPIPVGNKEPAYDVLVDPTHPKPPISKQSLLKLAPNKLPSSVPTSPLTKPSIVLPAIPSKPIGNKEPTYKMLQEPTPPTKPSTSITETTPEENIAYLKTLDGESMLQLLGDMNLAEYKDSFQREQVDGELLADLAKDELEDLGVTKKIHQLRLMKLIDGSTSAKKYEGGLYGTLS